MASVSTLYWKFNCLPFISTGYLWRTLKPCIPCLSNADLVSGITVALLTELFYGVTFFLHPLVSVGSLAGPVAKSVSHSGSSIGCRQ